MSQSYYSWCGTRLHLILDDDLAKAFNRADTKFVHAQKQFKADNGRDWKPLEDFLDHGWDGEELMAWNAISEIINHLVKINGGTLQITKTEMSTRHLIKL